MSNERKRKSQLGWKRVVAIALFWVALVELTAFAGTALLAKRGFLFVPQDATGYEDYLARRDPIVGWPAPPTFGTGELDAIGSRLVPNFPEPGARACVSFFGDSFTFGDEVGPAESYPNVVAGLLGCRVNNFGVGGYGTDQAFLRYRDVVKDDSAPFAVLGHYSENIIRNVNQFRGYLSPSRFGLKPRFVLAGDGSLRLIPLPEPTRAEYEEIAAGRPVTLQHEHWVPESSSGIVTGQFPFSLTALRFLGQYRVRARLRGIPSYQPFYDGDHPSHALAITHAILTSFVEAARQRGQQPIVVLIPDVKDLQALRAQRDLPYAPLESSLRAAGVDAVPVAEQLLTHLAGREPGTIYTQADGGGHFNAEGYALVARIIADRIRALQGEGGALKAGAL
jgi:hypothetical protein